MTASEPMRCDHVSAWLSPSLDHPAAAGAAYSQAAPGNRSSEAPGIVAPHKSTTAVAIARPFIRPLPDPPRQRTIASGRRPVDVGLQRRVEKAVDRSRGAVAAAELDDLAGEPRQLEAAAAKQVIPRRGHVVC